jgi:hypothetical protein
MRDLGKEFSALPRDVAEVSDALAARPQSWAEILSSQLPTKPRLRPRHQHQHQHQQVQRAVGAGNLSASELAAEHARQMREHGNNL